MENTLITVKEYSDQRGKSVQATYKQIQRHKDELKDHVIRRDKKTYLDEEAVRILNEASNQTPTIIVENAKDEVIDQQKQEIEALKNKIMLMEESFRSELIKRDDKILELTDRVLLLTAKPDQEDQKKKSWFKRLFQ